MELDLTSMTPEMTRELNRIAERYRKPYTEFIDRLSELFADAKFWWDTPLASRNIYICRNFLDICILRLAMDIANQGQLTEWVVHNRGMQQALKDNLGTCDIQVTSGVQLGIKAKIKEKILSAPLAASEYAFYAFQRRIRDRQKRHGKKGLDAFRGRALTLVSTYRVPAEVKNGVLQDRYFPGLKENGDEDIVFFAHPVFGNEAEGKQLLDVLHARDDHICIHDWIEPDDFREVREYIQWCRNVRVPQCTFDGMDVTALVKEAFRTGASDNNTMYGIVKGRVLCRLVKQYDLKIKCLIDWYEGQPSSNAMIRRFRAKFPDVPTVAYVWTPCGENNLGQYPSKKQVEQKRVPEFYAVQGTAWENTVRQFSNQLKCVMAPSLRYQAVFQDDIQEQGQRQGLLVVLSYLQEQSTQLLQALGDALSRLENSALGPIYIKNHPLNEHMKIVDYGVSEENFHNYQVEYLRCPMQEALIGKKMALLSMTSSTLEVMLSGCYTMNFISAGNLTAVYLPKNADKNCTIVYSAEDIRSCILRQGTGLSKEEADSLRETAFTRTNQKTVSGFFDSIMMERDSQ